MILVVGATSRLGQAICERLLAEGTAFRAACRNPAKAGRLSAAGVEVVAIDIDDDASVARAMVGTDRVVTAIHGLMGRSRRSIRRVDVDGHRRLIDTAVAAGVERFVYTSARGAAPDHPSEFWRAKAATEDYLRKSGLRYVILRPSAFMDLYAHDLIGAAVLRGKRVSLLGSGAVRRNMIAVADVALAVLLALDRPDLEDQTLELTGHDNVTDREVAVLYSKLSGRSVRLLALPGWALPVLAGIATPFHAGIGRVLRMPHETAGRPDLCGNPSETSQAFDFEPEQLSAFVHSKLDRKL